MVALLGILVLAFLCTLLTSWIRKSQEQIHRRAAQQVSSAPPRAIEMSEIQKPEAKKSVGEYQPITIGNGVDESFS